MADSATWTVTTKSLINKLAKAREITPSDVVTLLRFVTMGERKLSEGDEPKERLQVAS